MLFHYQLITRGVLKEIKYIENASYIRYKVEWLQKHKCQFSLRCVQLYQGH